MCGATIRSAPTEDICLSLRSGEIVGIAGISGNGQQELLKVISGERTLGCAKARCASASRTSARSMRRSAASWGLASCRKSGSGAARCPTCRWPITRC
jgi:simple sugar transport system ATP-binding protein